MRSVREMGLNTGHSLTAQQLGFVKKIMEYPPPFFLMETCFILLGKYYFTNGEKTGRTCTKIQTVIFLDGAIISVVDVFPLYYLVVVCFVSKNEYI